MLRYLTPHGFISAEPLLAQQRIVRFAAENAQDGQEACGKLVQEVHGPKDRLCMPGLISRSSSNGKTYFPVQGGVSWYDDTRNVKPFFELPPPWGAKRSIKRGTDTCAAGNSNGCSASAVPTFYSSIKKGEVWALRIMNGSLWEDFKSETPVKNVSTCFLFVVEASPRFVACTSFSRFQRQTDSLRFAHRNFNITSCCASSARTNSRASPMRKPCLLRRRWRW